MKFLIMEPSPLPIRLPLGSEYSRQDHIFKYPYVRDPKYIYHWNFFKVKVLIPSWSRTVDHLLCTNLNKEFRPEPFQGI